MLTSLWESRRRPTDAADPAPLSAAATARHGVVVVGGGITGLTTALLLARAGRSVMVVEARRTGAGTTGRSTAKVSLLQGTQLSRIRRAHGVATLTSYVDGNRAAQEWIAAFADDAGVPVERRPATTYAHGQPGLRLVRRELAAARAAGLPATWTDDLELPYPVAGAVRLDDQLQLDPVELVDALASACRTAGVVVLEGWHVRRVHGHRPVHLDVSPDGADDPAERQQLSGDRVVLATNTPILDRGGFFARLSAQRSYSIAFRTPGPVLHGMHLAADAPSRSLRDAPTGDGDGTGARILLVGGEGHAVGRSRPTSEHLDTLRTWTARHFPDARETHAWSAQDYAPHHALPYAGPLVPGRDDVLVAGGFSKWGMTGGVAAALAVAGALSGGAPPWSRALRSWGPRELAGLPKAALLNTEVALSLGAGWLRPLVPGGPPEREAAVRYGGARPPQASCGVGGVEHRVSAVCSHLGGVVAWNDAERSWDCPLHGSRFRPDGEVLDGPATRPLPAGG